jgi:uncharacterized protein YciI
MKIGPLPDALDSGFHCVRAHCIRGFMTFQRARCTRSVMLMVPGGLSPVSGREAEAEMGGAAGRRGGRIVGGEAYGPGMGNFAVRLVHGPGWDPGRPIREQDGWDEHAAFMDGLVEDGFIILGGPVGDGEQTLHAVEAADEGEIRTRLALDPWASAGLLRVGPVEPWALWLDGRG